MKFDLRDFKKIHADKNRTIMQHPSGHTIHLVHKKLEPDHREQLKKLPMPPNGKAMRSFADGGEVKAPWDDAQRLEHINEIRMSQHLEPLKEIPASVVEPGSVGSKIAQTMEGNLPSEPQPDVTLQTDLSPPPMEDQGLSNYQLQPQQPSQTQQDPFGTLTRGSMYAQGLEEQRSGLQGQMQAAEQLGQQQSQAAEKGLGQARANQQNYQQQERSLMDERMAFVNDYKNQHINPNHYFQSMSTMGKLLTAFGLIAGGVDTAKFVSDQINRDIKAQEETLGIKRSLLEANMKQFGNLHQAQLATRSQMLDIVNMEMQKAEAQAKGPMEKARLQQKIGELDAESSTILGQLQAQKSVLQGFKSGKINPGAVIRYVIPADKQKEAYEELGVAENLNLASKQIGDLMQKAHKASRVGQFGSLPFTTSSKILKETEAQLRSLMQANWKGPMTDDEAKKIVEPYLSGWTDDPDDLQRRISGMRDMLQRNAKPTPLLNDYQIRPQQVKSSPNLNAPSGYNKR